MYECAACLVLVDCGWVRVTSADNFVVVRLLQVPHTHILTCWLAGWLTDTCIETKERRRKNARLHTAKKWLEKEGKKCSQRAHLGWMEDPTIDTRWLLPMAMAQKSASSLFAKFVRCQIS